jgi:2-keto-3-deoxy-6-phosphogluconate aldolase
VCCSLHPQHSLKLPVRGGISTYYVPAYLTVPAKMIGNLSTTLVTPTSSQQGRYCCNVEHRNVFLHFWWNTTYTAYPTTVITQYLQYNNTVVTNYSTVIDQYLDPGTNAPSGIITTREYGYSSFHTTGTVSDKSWTTAMYGPMHNL